MTDSFYPQRVAMVAAQLRQRGIRDERVLAAMERVPRHEFVRADKQHEAYEDQPVAIEAGQTLSQPYIVAAMLEAIALRAADTVLEIGTGSGYQTAILAELAQKVYTVERHAALSTSAQERLFSLGNTSVTFVVGDGSLGLPQHAPYDAIVVSAAAPRVPESLVAQLAEGGRLIVPVGHADSQQLELVRKVGGRASATTLDGCRFVPLIGREGFPG
jgi:protein-L-isoaspartate(D-aspartate) O-methyltransferase